MALPNTHFGKDKLAVMLEGKKTLRFLGIGGVSMCSLARVAALTGHNVSGYDRADTDITRALAADGIEITAEERPDLAAAADLIVYTVAVSPDNAELVRAAELEIPCVSRADFLGWAMSDYVERIGVSGTHGKSTTTSMLAKIFTDANTDPTVNCGAIISDLGATHRVGKSKNFFIYEACEYMDSFLDFYPTTAVVLNIELDHTDYFKSMEQLRASFGRFMGLTEGETNGTAVINADDDDVMEAARDYHGKKLTFSVRDPGADYCACNVEMRHSFASFDISHGGEVLLHVSLAVPKRCCIADATAAAAAAHNCGVAPAVIAASLSTFHGVRRRMEYFGKTPLGADVYEDYAHHPTEIATTLTGAADMDYNRVICVFQPHTYSRTASLYDDFTETLSLADEVVVADIFPARETDDLGMSGAKLAGDIENATYLPSFEAIADYINKTAREGELVIIMGAGDIDKVTQLITVKK